MTDTRRPDPCTYDRRRGHRVTRRHRDDCATNTCPGCQPCTARHCVVCGRGHVTNSEPLTCARCVGRVVDDLQDIRDGYALLATEALEAGGDGRLVAAAPIPGGTAQVLIGPTVRLDLLRVNRHTRDDHAVDRKGRSRDPIPPLAVLAQWEDMYRAWLDHTPGRGRATIGRAIGYLVDQVPYLANDTEPGGPDWLAFTRQVRQLRADIELALHDERDPERGVECFECGDQLVRRFGRANRCRHSTPIREWIRMCLELDYLEVLDERTWREARRPCGDCDQGGLHDPSAGQSWECPGCRKEYDPGEYATAVRRDLLEGGPDGDGWTHVAMAAEAASMMTGVTFGSDRIRRWMDRGQVASMCQWKPDTVAGLRLVLWSDVKERAAEAVARAEVIEAERRREAEQEQALRDAVAKGRRPAAAGKRLGIHPKRVEKFLEKWAVEARREARKHAS